MYQSPSMSNEWIDTGLTLEEAQAHCKDPETSSSTATSQSLVTLTHLFGEWFDKYEEET